MKKFSIGIGLVVVSILISLLFSDFSLMYKITGVIALLSLAASAFLSGAFVSGDRLGRNLQSESKEDRNQRFSLTSSILLVGLPSGVVAVISYFLLI